MMNEEYRSSLYGRICNILPYARDQNEEAARRHQARYKICLVSSMVYLIII
jgi:hypothetical protein